MGMEYLILEGTDFLSIIELLWIRMAAGRLMDMKSLRNLVVVVYQQQDQRYLHQLVVVINLVDLELSIEFVVKIPLLLIWVVTRKRTKKEWFAQTMEKRIRLTAHMILAPTSVLIVNAKNQHRFRRNLFHHQLLPYHQ